MPKVRPTPNLKAQVAQIAPLYKKLEIFRRKTPELRTQRPDAPCFSAGLLQQGRDRSTSVENDSPVVCIKIQWATHLHTTDLQEKEIAPVPTGFSRFQFHLRPCWSTFTSIPTDPAELPSPSPTKFVSTPIPSPLVPQSTVRI